MKEPTAMAIIISLLDLDFYKLTMAYFAWKLHRGARVKYAFKNRTTKVRLADFIAEADLRRELDHVRRLGFTARELAWVGRHLRDEDFINFLAGLHLPPYELAVQDGQFVITVEGTWPEAIWWETLILSIVNELYYRRRLADSGRTLAEVEAEGHRRLKAKIARLNARAVPAAISEFGTRRRFSRHWQEQVMRRLAEELKGFVGTSNCRLALGYDLRPIGTMAHETFMVYSGLYRHLDTDRLRSHRRLLEDWYAVHGAPLSIALTDTFGTKFFFEDFTSEMARAWRGLRQDSGDAFAFGETAIGFYAGLGLDPTTKTVVFSDGLDVDAIEALEDRFVGRVGTSYGWGTTLTNDVGFETLSLVMKAVEADGHALVKLSDNVQKAIGPADEVERLKRLAGYAGGLNQECVV